MCGPKGASTSLHWDGRCGDISAVHINLKGINQVLIFPRQQDTQQAEDIFNLLGLGLTNFPDSFVSLSYIEP